MKKGSAFIMDITLLVYTNILSKVYKVNTVIKSIVVSTYKNIRILSNEVTTFFEFYFHIQFLTPNHTPHQKLNEFLTKFFYFNFSYQDNR